MPPRAGLQRESTAAKAMVAMIDFVSFIPWGVSKVTSFSVYIITSITSVLITAGGMGLKGGLQMIGAGVVVGGTCLYIERNFHILQSVSCFISPTPSCNLIGQ